MSNIEQINEVNLDNSIKLSVDFGADYFNRLDNIVGNAIKNVDDNIDHFDIEALNQLDISRPPYYKGTFNENGIPLGEKQKFLWNRIVKALDWIVLVEGGVRGGKDVMALKAWGDYLMICPETQHIALGITLEHALQTILLNNGFGIRYVLPHGRFIRKSINGAMRGVYEFTDAYGVQKEILFYGNSKKDDWEKYHGFSIGSFYINEGRNQHINGLQEAVARTSASQYKLIIITQNPTGSANVFYREFEMPNTGSEADVNLIERIKDEYTHIFAQQELRMYAKMRETIKAKLGEFLTNKGVPLEWDEVTKKYGGYDYLIDEDQVEYTTLEKKIRFDFEHGVRSLQVKDFVDWLPVVDSKGRPNLIAGMSMKKVVNYERALSNPNKVENYIDYSYHHFTFEDNPKMSDADRNDLHRKYPHGTAIYEQMVLGIRKSVENALYPMFDKNNILDKDSPYYDITIFEGNRRYTPFVAVDVGFNHYTGMIYGYIDYSNGDMFVVKEGIYGKSEVQEPKDVLDRYLVLIRSINNRRIPMTCMDPSANATINHFLNQGVDVIPADNSRLMPEELEKKYANKLQQKDLIGFELVRTYMKLNKLFVHISCPNLIAQIDSAEWVHDAEKDKDTRNKSNDDLSDPLRYALNTFIGGTEYIIMDERSNADDTETIRKNEETEIGEGDLATRLQRRSNERRKGSVFNDYYDNRVERLETTRSGYRKKTFIN